MPADRNTKIVTRNFGVENSNRIDVAMARGAYGRLAAGFRLQPAALTDEVKKSNLRGRGGAGFPTGMKWGFIPKGAQTVYLVVNADESEPGTCKDRELIFWDPHLMIEGIILASYALGCKHAYIYIRGEMIREVAKDWVTYGDPPHRFEAGWWSAEDEGAGDPGNACAGLALRDYFVAHNDVAGLVWVFRERLAPQPGGAVQKDATQKDATQKGAMKAAQPHRWFLHGIFG